MASTTRESPSADALEIEVVATAAPEGPPVLLPCSPAGEPVLYPDGLFCNGPDGLGFFGLDGGLTVFSPSVGSVERLAGRRFVFQTYDDNEPLIEAAFRYSRFRYSRIELFDLDSATPLTPHTPGFLGSVHEDRFVFHSDLPEAWLWNQPDDIGWHVLDLDTGRVGLLRPEATVHDVQVGVYGVWGPSDSPNDRFLGPMP